MWIRTDPLLLERILLNVISNALRYTDHGRILIGCRRRGENVEVIVADTGIGIAPDHLPHIFQEFYRAAPGHSGASPGLGLGLAIVKSYVDLMGGTIRVDSSAAGTVFLVDLPFVPSVATLKTAVQAAPVLAR